MAEVWLLRLSPPGQSLDLPGWFLYAASADAVPVDRYGRSLRHPAGLAEVEVIERIDITDSGASGDHSARVAVYLTPDPALLLSQSWRLSGWIGELSIWTVGASYESREVVFRGAVEAGALPGPGEALELTLMPPEFDTGTEFPPSNAVIEAGDTWTTPQSSGDSYPWVFGAPGVYRSTTGASTLTSASRCYVVDTTAAAQVGLIAGHRVRASTVSVYSAPEETDATFAVVHQQDGRGRTVATVDLSGKNGVWTLDDTAELYVNDWNDGGIATPYGKGPLDGAGDVLFYLLSQQRSGMLDERSWRSVLGRLNRYRLDGVWSESALPWEWAQQQILPLLPGLWVLSGPFGARPILLDDCPPEVMLPVVVGREVYRPDGGVPEDQGSSSIVSRVTVSYALRVRYDKFKAQVAMTWSRRRSEVEGSGETSTARGAATLVGDVEVSIDATALYSRSDAYRLACSHLEMYGRGATVNEVWAPLGRRKRYPLGRGLRVTDTDYSYADRVCYVTGRRLTLDRVELTLTDLK